MYLGVDIGGTTILAGLVNKSGDIFKFLEIKTEREKGYKYIEKNIINILGELINNSKNLNNIKGIGIGVPGIADINSDNIIYCTNLGWKNVPLGIKIKEVFGLPVYIENDATVAGLAEKIKGVTKDAINSIFITIGTGIGGGIIINNKIYSGSHKKGSEIGHMIVGKNFYDCNCGNNGCLETFSSATAMIKYAKKLMSDGQKTTLLDKMEGSTEDIDAKMIVECAKNGDKVCNKVVDRMVKYLSLGIGNLINLLDPDIIVIGGGVSKAGDFLLQKIRSEVYNFVIFKEEKKTEIVLAELGNEAGLIGAALLPFYM